MRPLRYSINVTKVDGIECANRFDRKRTADSIEYRSINVEDVVAPLKRPEGRTAGRPKRS